MTNPTSSTNSTMTIDELFVSSFVFEGEVNISIFAQN